jgi:hypothetical protein
MNGSVGAARCPQEDFLRWVAQCGRSGLLLNPTVVHGGTSTDWETLYPGGQLLRINRRHAAGLAVPGAARFGHRDIQVSPRMLHQARQAPQPVLGRGTLTLPHAAADAFEPLATAQRTGLRHGPDHLLPVLSLGERSRDPGDGRPGHHTGCRTAVAITGDGSLWAHDAEGTRALRELIQRYLGAERPAGAFRVTPRPWRRLAHDGLYNDRWVAGGWLGTRAATSARPSEDGRWFEHGEGFDAHGGWPF